LTEAVPGKIRVSRDLGSFASLWPRCDTPGPARCHVFQCADVLEVWLKTIGAARGVDPYFVVVTDERGEPRFAVALGIERRFGVRVLTFLDGGVSDYNAPVVFANGTAARPYPLRQLIERLRGVLPPFDLVMFEKMPADVLGLPNPLVRPGMEGHTPSGHVTTLAGTWVDAAKRLPRGQDSRRKRRKLEAMGKLAFVVADGAASRERLLDAMIRQKTRRYIETRGWDGFDRPGYRDYFRQMTERLGPPGIVHLSALTLGDQVVAAHWGMVCGMRLYSLMPSFEAEWSRFSPGRLLLEHLFEWSYARGIACFDFGIGDEAYKFEFRDGVLPLYRAVIPVTMAGSAYVFALNRKNELRASRAWTWLRALRSRAGAQLETRAAP
jgi:CelD/BcsL family acetyltransferase involved in cellulose biosynthesis